MPESRPETASSGGRAARPLDRPVVLFLVAGLTYYVGARIGLLLRFPPATTSVIWPPNALLTSLLLLTPPTRWWIVVLASLPAHLLVEVRAGFPPALVAALFATNCFEALAAAGIVRRLSDDTTAFDSLRRALAFVVGAVFLAPVLSTFPDAAAVHAFQGEPFGLVCLRRVLSNSLSQLTLVPAVVLAARYGPASWRASTRRRRAEALLIALALAVVGGLVFGGHEGESPLPPGGPYTALPLLAPLLILATVRFGPAGASLSLLASALLAIGSAISGRSPLTGLPAEERVLALQVFLIVVGVPLLVLGGVMEERRQIAATLRERLRFEAFLSAFSGAFVRLPSHRMSVEFENWLERVGTFVDVDRATLWQLTADSDRLLPVAFWSAPSAGPPPASLDRSEFGWAAKRLLLREPFVFSDPDTLPAGAPAEAAALRLLGVRSLLVLPLVAGDQVIGGLALVTTGRPRRWQEAIVRNCRLIADVFAGALARKVAEDALRASETMKSAVLASLTSHVAVIDRDGRIIAVNESWLRYARDNAASLGEAVGVGASYLDACRHASERGDEQAREALAGVEAVLQGARTEFRQEYACPNAEGDRWFHMTVVPLDRPEGGAVISHVDVTDRRRASVEAEQSRQELAHTLRLSTVGELTTSIAHELNQPLAAILANAQAARRLLTGTAAGVATSELQDILADIIEDDRRAGDVIRGLRDLLRKGHTQRREIELNELVRGVVKLLGGDLMIRGVTLRSSLADEALTTSGDPVQLQQVLLNLVVNALEAVGEAAGERRIGIETERAPSGMARVSIEDTGPGLPAGLGGEVFKPFFTTKPKGMGMGLSIARTIVEAHGGTISAEDRGERGACFTFSLPLTPARPAGAARP